MMALDMYWTTNKDWHEIVRKEDGRFDDRIKDNAPPEAKASYYHYLEQIREAAEMENRLHCHVI